MTKISIYIKKRHFSSLHDARNDHLATLELERVSQVGDRNGKGAFYSGVDGLKFLPQLWSYVDEKKMSKTRSRFCKA